MNEESRPDEKRRLALHCAALSLTVEFSLGRGEYARIGTTPEMEITLPLAGLREEECRLSCDDEGVLWLAFPGGGSVRSPEGFMAGAWYFIIKEAPRSRALPPPVPVVSPPPAPVKLPPPVPLAVSPAGPVVSPPPVSRQVAAPPLDSPAHDFSSPEACLEEPLPLPSRRMAGWKKAVLAGGMAALIAGGYLFWSAAQARLEKIAPFDLGSEHIDVKRIENLTRGSIFLVESRGAKDVLLGSGIAFAVSADGMVVTDSRFIALGRSLVAVTQENVRVGVTRVLAVDRRAGLAVLQLERGSGTVLTLSDTARMERYRRVATYEFHEGWSVSLEAGRFMKKEPGEDAGEFQVDDMLETNVHFVAGSSGSPLLDAEGKVVGVMLIYKDRAGGHRGSGAVPAERLAALLERARSAPEPPSDTVTQPSPALEEKPRPFTFVAGSSSLPPAADGPQLPKKLVNTVDWTPVNFLRYKALVEKGDVAACGRLGFCYELGLGTEKNPGEAAKWYLKGAEAGDAHAQHLLGSLYLRGLGVSKDPQKALSWLLKAATQLNERVLFETLGDLYARNSALPRNFPEAMKWYRKAAALASPGAEYGVGMLYQAGSGVPKDMAESMKWIRQAALHGLAEAQYHMGQSFFNGEGVVRDFAEARKWFRLAADQGDSGAQYNLGLLYMKGEGVPKDRKAAAPWLEKAALQDHAGAQYAFGLIYHEGVGLPRDIALAYAWINAAAEHGMKEAASWIAKFRQLTPLETKAQAERAASDIRGKLAQEKERRAAADASK